MTVTHLLHGTEQEKFRHWCGYGGSCWHLTSQPEACQIPDYCKENGRGGVNQGSKINIIHMNDLCFVEVNEDLNIYM